MPEPAPPPPTPLHDLAALESLASAAALAAAELIRARLPARDDVATKSTPTDIVTQTDVDSERLIRDHLITATPDAGFVGEEGGTSHGGRRLQWVVDPLDGTVNFWYRLPVIAVSVAAAVDGVIVAGAVVDVMRLEVFSATRDGGSRRDGQTVSVSDRELLSQSLVTTGFSYRSGVRRAQGAVAARILPAVRDIRCFGSAALQLCWVGCGRSDAHFERDIKIWDYSAGALIASEAGADVELPCPENGGLVLAATPAVFAPLRRALDDG